MAMILLKPPPREGVDAFRAVKPEQLDSLAKEIKALSELLRSEREKSKKAVQ